MPKTVIKPRRTVVHVKSGRTIKVSVPGKQGPPGESGAAVTSYVHNQLEPSDIWVAIHNLGFEPNVSVFNSANDPVYGVYVVHDSLNQTTLSFSAPFAGRANFS